MNVSYSFGKCPWTTAINEKCFVAFKLVGHGAYSDNSFFIFFVPASPYSLCSFPLLSRCSSLSENSSFWKTQKILQIDFIYLFLIKNKQTLEMHTV